MLSLGRRENGGISNGVVKICPKEEKCDEFIRFSNQVSGGKLPKHPLTMANYHLVQQRGQFVIFPTNQKCTAKVVAIYVHGDPSDASGDSIKCQK